MTGLRTACALTLVADVAAAGLYAGVKVARWRPADHLGRPHTAAEDVDVDQCNVTPLGVVSAEGRVVNPDPRGWRYVVNVDVTDTATGRLLEPLQAVVDVGPIDSARWATPAGRTVIPADVGVTCRPARVGRTPTL